MYILSFREYYVYGIRIEISFLKKELPQILIWNRLFDNYPYQPAFQSNSNQLFTAGKRANFFGKRTKSGWGTIFRSSDGVTRSEKLKWVLSPLASLDISYRVNKSYSSKKWIWWCIFFTKVRKLSTRLSIKLLTNIEPT